MKKFTNKWKFQFGLVGLWKDLKQVNPPSFSSKIDKSMILVYLVYQERIQEGFMTVYGCSETDSPSQGLSPTWKIRATPKSPTILAPKKTCDSDRYLRESNTLDTAFQLEEKCWKVCVCFVKPFWGEGDSYVERSIYKFEYREWLHSKTLYIVVFIEIK